MKRHRVRPQLRFEAPNAIASGGLKWQYIAIIDTFSSCHYFMPVAYAGFYLGGSSARPRGLRCEAQRAERGVGFWIWGSAVSSPGVSEAEPGRSAIFLYFKSTGWHLLLHSKDFPHQEVICSATRKKLCFLEANWNSNCDSTFHHASTANAQKRRSKKTCGCQWGF